jgi:hypothetical protein
MRALSHFEELLEGLVEGSFRRLFRGRLEPVDIARGLARVMDDNKRVTWERPLVPNRYHVALASADYAGLESFAASLRRELARFVTERAAERGYGMLGPAEVHLEGAAAVPAGSVQVRAALVDVPPPAGAAAEHGHPEEFAPTRAMRPLEMPVGPAGSEALYLVGELDGRQLSFRVAKARVSIGRGLDNDVVLEDASVSRHHAEITREGGRTQIRDLGSTNGTWVNAGRVAVAAVQPGDQLAFGAVHLDVTRRSGDHSGDR